jgi:hypothetical protein
MARAAAIPCLDIHKHTANAATKVLTFPPWENQPPSHMKGIFISLFLPCVKGSERES